MTMHEVYVSLFWIVIGGYVTYLGWTLYRIAAERATRARHPSSLPQLAGGDAEVRGRGGSLSCPPAVGEMSKYETEGTNSGADREPSASSRSILEL
jgi:hypothetical protein